MSFCEQCGTYIGPDAKVCPTCGAAQTQRGEPEKIWFSELGETPKGSLLATDKLLLIPTQGEGLTAQHTTLRALELRDGSLAWQKQIQHASVSGMASAGDLILVATYSTDLLRGQGALLAFDATGTAGWSCKPPGAQRISAPAVSGSTVCITVDTKTLVVLDAATGAERARAHLGASAAPSAPAVVEDVAYVPCRGPHLLAVGLDGKLRWQFTDPDDPDAWLDKTPVLVGKHLCAVSTTGSVLALKTEDRTLAWRAGVGPAGKSLSPPASDGKSLYVGARDGLHALGGDVAWHTSTERRITAAPVVADGVVYATGHDHNLYALDAVTGLELWRVELTRRIEVSPVISGDLVLAADRDGRVVAVKRVVSAIERASAHAATGQFQRAAELLEEQHESFKAAEMYKEAGDLTRASGLYQRSGALQQAADMLKAAGEQEQAAALYEQAGIWTQAIRLWEALGRPLKQAQALKKCAESMDEKSHSWEDIVAVWEQAAHYFGAEGELEQVAVCRQQIARYRQLPILDLDVHSEGLVVNAWSRIQLVVRNEGYGPARNLVVRAEGKQFEGQVMTTQRIATLHAGRTRCEWLDVRPLEYGGSVPLRVSVEYVDPDGQSQVYQETLYMPVARSDADRGAGQVYNINVSGPVSIGGGEAVDMRGAQGALYRPSDQVQQHFGDVVHQVDTGRSQGRREERRIDAAVPSNAETGRPIDLFVQVRFPDSPLLSVKDWPTKQKPASIEQQTELVALEYPIDELTRKPTAALLEICVVTADFEVEGGKSRLLEVPPGQISKRISFLLIPQKEGNCRINVEVYSIARPHLCLGTIPLETTVGEAVETKKMNVANLLLVVMTKRSSLGHTESVRRRDFELLIDGSQATGYHVRVVRSTTGEASGDFRLPFTLEELADVWQRLERGESDEAFLKDVGSRLFEALFDGVVGGCFHNSQGALGAGEVLRLRLRVEAGELLSVPWELLYDPGRRDFLCLTRHMPLIRHLPVPRPAAIHPIAPPLHMLVVPASPKGLPPLGVDDEVASLRQAVQPLVDANLLALEVLQPPTVNALLAYLVDHPCHILHFIGHGGHGPGGGFISFENAAGGAHDIGASQLKVLFTHTSLRLVVLAACLTALDTSAKDASGRAYLGVAPAIVDAGVPAVVAMQFSLTGRGGRLFAQDFYHTLARRRPVEEAVDQARVAVMLGMGLDMGCRDWAAPVLFLRGDLGELFPER